MSTTDQKVQSYLTRATVIANASIENFANWKNNYEQAMIIAQIANLVRVEDVKG